MNSQKELKHNQLAPYWAIGFFVFLSIGLATICFDNSSNIFWKGYALDMVGPAWNYILFRGLFTYYADNLWTRFFTPKKTLILFIFVCVTIEGAQYYKLYDGTYDFLDFLAYISFLIPLFIVDTYQFNFSKREF